MALNDSTAVVASGGFLFFAPVGTVDPATWETADLSSTTPFAGWENVGHTSLENLPEFGSDGGDSETIGSWQKRVLRQQQTETSTDYLNFNAYQFDRNVLEMYWGTGGTVEAGRFGVKSVGANRVEKAFLMIITDGAVRVGFYVPRAQFGRNDALSLATDNFAEWPIRATFLNYQDEDLFTWLGDGITVAA